MFDASPAQTNLQLFAQLHQRHYNRAEIETVRDAYMLAADIFAGQYRGSGKTFLAHLIGTASVLANEGAPVAYVCAGLLHSAYASGEFGLLLRRNMQPKRERVRAAAGEFAEGLVDAYTALRWNNLAVQDFLTEHARSPISWNWMKTATAGNRRCAVIALRLANEIDEHADDGNMHRLDFAHQRENTRASIDLWRTAANVLGLRSMTESFARIADDAAKVSDIPAPLISAPSHEAFTLSPRSYRKRFEFALQDRIDDFRSRMRRAEKSAR